MKSFKLMAAALLAAVFASTAGAQTVVYISGAPAFRQVGTTAIIHALGGTSYTGGNSVPSPLTVAYTGSSLLTANQVNIYGGTVGGNSVIVKVSYTGSTAGLIAVSSGANVLFLETYSSGSTPLSGSGQSDPTAAGATDSDSHLPDFTLSDEYQDTTPFTGVNNSITGTPVTYQNLTDQIVGILPYEFVSNVDAPVRLTNIHSEQAQQLWGNGQIPLSLLTGSNSDEGTTVWAIGRDIGSGLRNVLLAETGVGVNTQITQYQPITSAGIASFTVTSSGSGYTSAPTVKISVSGGYGYTSAPTVVFTGGGGAGAAATATLTNGTVTALTLTNQGTGYTSAPAVTFTGGSPTTAASGASATISSASGQVTSVSLANPGYGAAATATVSGGAVTAVNITSGSNGAGFVSAPTISLSGGGGSGAAVTAVLQTGTVSGQVPYPEEVVNGVDLPVGDGGYSSFTGLLAALSANTGGASGAIGGYYVTGLASPDAATAIAAGAHPLTWNGVSLGTLGTVGTASAQIAEGEYTFWSYIHIDFLPSHLSSLTVQLATKDAIRSFLRNSDSTVLLKDVNVSRNVDGGAVNAGAYLPTYSD